MTELLPLSTVLLQMRRWRQQQLQDLQVGWVPAVVLQEHLMVMPCNGALSQRACWRLHVQVGTVRLAEPAMYLHVHAGSFASLACLVMTLPLAAILLLACITDGGIAVFMVHDSNPTVSRASQGGELPTIPASCPQLYTGHHPQGVNDIAFANPAFSADALASVGEGGELVVWDIREPQPVQVVREAHHEAANTLSFDPSLPHQLATGEVLVWVRGCLSRCQQHTSPGGLCG